MRRGFTILELLVSIGILLLLAAIALPYAWSALGRHELDAGEDHLTMQLVMARAAAREEGQAVEIVALSDGEGAETLQARFFATTPATSEAADDEDAGHADGEACIRASWARWTLPDGMTLDIQFAAQTDDDDEDEDAKSKETASGTRTVALFLPDGTALIAPTLVLAMQGGTARSLLIDPVTGRPRRADVVRVVDDTDRPEFEPVSGDDGAE